MRFVTIVGARPQFIKAAPLSDRLRREHEEHLIHTGQHYDDEMSEVFFRELDIPAPERNLGVRSGPHGVQTAAMLERIENALQELRPDAVIVLGDTNSTLAGALAAVKLHLPVAHVEAGLRSFNREMPEEINRIVADHVSRWLFAPSEAAVARLNAEGIFEGVYNVGDIMLDCVRRFAPLARQRSSILARLGLQPKGFCVATVHRAGNTDCRHRLAGILQGLRDVPLPVVFPMHPRTRAAIERHQLNKLVDCFPASNPESLRGRRLIAIAPLSYLDMLQLQQNARAVFTDSGGLQKEAYYVGVPCVTLRDETEWSETVEAGWNVLVGADASRIATALEASPTNGRPPIYGDGNTAEKIAGVLGAA